MSTQGISRPDRDENGRCWGCLCLDSASRAPREKAIAEALKIVRGETFELVPMFMCSGVWGDENRWEQCEATDEGATPFWRMEVQ